MAQMASGNDSSALLLNDRHPVKTLKELAAQSQMKLGDASFAKFMDARDSLKDLRGEFNIPTLGSLLHNAPVERRDEECAYFCGNSLGLQPKETRRLLMEELDVWSRRAVNGHFDHMFARPWVAIDETVKDQSAKIVGALPSEVAVMNSLTVNVHLLLCSFYTPTPTRHKILLEAKAFPSDHIKLHGYNPSDSMILATPRAGEETLRTEDILDLIEREGESIAVILFSGVQYYTGQCFDMKAITEAGHRKGCIVGFDLAHAAGNVVLHLHDWQVDFACWCSYKYLNAGPGGISAIFVHDKYAKDFQRNRLVGWWAHDKTSRFKMENSFVPLEGAAGFQQSNPCVIATVALLGSLNVYSRTTMEALRAKSLLLTSYLEHLLHAEVLAKFPNALQIITPADVTQRGCQLSLLFSVDIKEIHDELENDGIIVDKREPRVLRVSPVPLYNTFSDVHRFVIALAAILSRSA